MIWALGCQLSQLERVSRQSGAKSLLHSGHSSIGVDQSAQAARPVQQDQVSGTGIRSSACLGAIRLRTNGRKAGCTCSGFASWSRQLEPKARDGEPMLLVSI